MEQQTLFNLEPKSEEEIEFEKYLEENWRIWEYFRHYALQAANAGAKRISARDIMSRIRWETYVNDKMSGWKVNHNWSPWLARHFIKEYPKYEDLFILKRSKADGLCDLSAQEPYSRTA